MKIHSLEINFYEGYSNNPVLEVTASDVPMNDSPPLFYEQFDSIHLAEKDGYVSFYSYKSPGRGYGGRAFPIIMKDGTKKTLIGPWSSRASYVNGIQPMQVMDITLHEVNGHRNWSAHCTLKIVQDFIKENDIPIDLLRVKAWPNEIMYVPCVRGDQNPKCGYPILDRWSVIL